LLRPPISVRPLAGWGSCLSPPDVATDTPENLGRFGVLPRWQKAREGLFHGQSAAFTVLVVLTCLPAGAEPETIPDQTARRLLEAVAERGYHDTSLLILDQLDDDQDLTEEFRRLIPLRRAAALVASVRLDPDQTKRQQVYADARTEIDRLLSSSNDSGVISEAALQRGLLLMEQGRLRREQASAAPDGIAAAAELFAEAVPALVGAAGAGPTGGSARVAIERELAEVNGRLAEYWNRQVLPRAERLACDRLEEKRERLRGRLVQLDLLAAEATAEQARCFPAGSEARRLGFKRAADQYRAIAEKQPTRAAGLWARVEEGRTLIDLGEGERGVNLLSEILKLPATEMLIERLQVRALAAILEYWQKTTDLRDDAGFDDRLRRRVLGLGPPDRLDADALQAKYAAARLLLRRAEEIPLADRLRRQPLIEDVRQLANDVAKAGGEHAAAAREMLEQLDSRGQAAARRLGQTFDAAVDQARRAIVAVQADPTDLRCAAAREQIQKALYVGRTDPPDDPAARQQQLLELRYQLAFVLYEWHRYHEAAAVGEEFLISAPAAPISRKAATIALASWQALQKQPNQAWSRTVVGQLARLIEVIMRQWPDDAESAAAALLAIDLAAASGDHAAIETILAGLPLTSDGRAEALLRGGVALWRLSNVEDEPDGSSAAKVSASRAARAASRLDEGLQLIADEPTLAEPIVSLAAAAAVARCQIALATGSEAAERLLPLLTHDLYGPWTLLRDPVAGLSPQLDEPGLTCCLMGFMRARQFDLAEEAITTLTQRLAEDGGAQVRLAATAGVLGRELFEELGAATPIPGREEALNLLVRLLAVAASPPAPRALMIWAATTLKQLGEAGGPLDQLVPRERRHDLLEQAAAAMQQLVAAEPATGQPSLRLQLAGVWTALGRWREALDQLDRVVTDPQAARSVLQQRKVAELLEALARTQPDAALARQLFRSAVMGRSVGRASAWGWGGLASRISRQAFSSEDEEARQLKALYFEARYRLASCRLAWANLEVDATAARRQLQQAAAELEIESRLHPDLGGKDFQHRFEQLREAISQELASPAGDDS
jgi:hypothetical protein